MKKILFFIQRYYTFRDSIERSALNIGYVREGVGVREGGGGGGIYIYFGQVHLEETQRHVSLKFQTSKNTYIVNVNSLTFYLNIQQYTCLVVYFVSDMCHIVSLQVFDVYIKKPLGPRRNSILFEFH